MEKRPSRDTRAISSCLIRPRDRCSCPPTLTSQEWNNGANDNKTQTQTTLHPQKQRYLRVLGYGTKSMDQLAVSIRTPKRETRITRSTKVPIRGTEIPHISRRASPSRALVTCQNCGSACSSLTGSSRSSRHNAWQGLRCSLGVVQLACSAAAQTEPRNNAKETVPRQERQNGCGLYEAVHFDFQCLVSL